MDLTPAEQVALDGAPMLIWVAGPGGRRTWVNHAFREFTGRAPGDALGERWMEPIHPDDRAAVETVYRRAMAQEEPFELDYRLRTSDGGYRWIMDRATPRRAADGRFLGYLGTGMDIQERRDLQVALDRARGEADAAAELIPALVFKTGAHGGFSYANHAWKEYTGFEPGAEPARGSWAPLVHEDDAEENRALWQTSLASGEPYETSYRLRRHDGMYRWHYVRAVPVRDANRAIVAWYGTCTDIDDKVRTDLALQASEERLRLAQRVAGMGTWEWDVAANFVSWSPEMEELYGTPQLGFDGEFDSYMAGVHPDDRAIMTDAIETMLRTGAMEMEHRVVRDDGEVRWVAARGEVFRNAAGRAVRGVGVALDITNRKRYELALARTEGRLRMLADAGEALANSETAAEMLAGVGRAVTAGFADLCVVDLVEGDRFVRTAVEHSPALDEADVRALWEPSPAVGDAGDVVSQVFHGVEPVVVMSADKVAVQMPSTARLAPGAAMILPLRRGTDAHGVLIIARAECERPFDRDDRETALDLGRRIAVTLSSLRHTLTLRKQSAIKDEVLGLISHELRTPLTTLKGNASTLSRHGTRVSEADRQTALEDISADADRLERIIENMLVLARVEGASDAEHEPILLHHLIRGVAAEFAERFPKHELRLDLAPATLLVLGHETYLHQVVMNLLSNSVKYGGGTPVELRTEIDGSRGLMFASDRGPGISPEQLTKVFQPFFRSRRDAGRAPGVGLGLTVCRRLLDELGGSIEAQVREGGGAEFMVTLPLMADIED